MLGTWSRSAVLAVMTTALVACGSNTEPPNTVAADWPAELRSRTDPSPEIQHQIIAYADEILVSAEEAERWITPALQYLTEVRSGRLEKLGHRLKSRDSTIRKIYSRWDRDRSQNPRDIRIADSVRYSIVINDSPPGHVDESIREILEIMDGVGHEVQAIKNYWLRGDDYSGVNGVLRAPNGTLWELQFHTDESFEAQDRVHPIYEVYRLPQKTEQERRDLYQQMSEVWNDVPIPVGILAPKSLHDKEEIIKDPLP